MKTKKTPILGVPSRVPVAAILTLALAIGAIGAAAPARLAAQSNEMIDTILAQDQITYGHAAYLLLTADGTVPDTASVTDAHRATEQAGTPAALGYPADRPLNLGELSLMVMQTFNVPGGLAYRIYPHPRYAARELAFRDIIQGQSYPRMAVSGERAMRIIGRVLTLEEEGVLR
jgi:hypothetical protein